MIQTETDNAIIDAILVGDKSKYELIMRRSNLRLYRVAKGILKNEEEVEDAMQDAYVKAYQQLSKFENRSSFITWITRILINECLMRNRKKKKVVELNEDQTDLIERPDYITPEVNMSNKELKSVLEKAISDLPEKYRMVFVMREIENMSVPETVETLEISESNVKTRLSRAKEMLRNTLTARIPQAELFEFNLVRCDRIVKYVFSRI